MPDSDPDVELWKTRYEGYSEAELEMKAERKRGDTPEHKAARHLLAEMRHNQAERRHQESIQRAEIAIIYAKWAMYASIVAVVVGLVGTILPFAVRTPMRTDAPSPSISSRETNHPSDATTSKPATQPTPEPAPPKPNAKPATSPPPPK